MKTKQILDTSFTVSLLKNIYRLYSRTELRISNIYRSSQTHRMIPRFRERIRVAFRSSFLGRTTSLEQENNLALLDNSRIIQYLINFYRRQRNKIIYSLNSSKTVGLTKKPKAKFISPSVKMVGVIISTAIIANLVSSIILEKEINFWGYLIRGLFLFMGIVGLFCNLDWKILISNSVVFKLINKR